MLPCGLKFLILFLEYIAHHRLKAEFTFLKTLGRGMQGSSDRW